MEAGLFSEGCLAPAAADEVHLFDDLHAIIQPGSALANGVLPARALLISSLRPSAPLVLLNVSLGDQADLARRRCGCPLERLGWTSHLAQVRSFEKLTAGGIALLDAEVLLALEEVLPGRFGGASTDFQLLEEEDGEGRPELVLLASPRLGRLDAEAVKTTFLAAVVGSSAASPTGQLFRQQVESLRIERRQPLAGASGKIQHLHAGAAGPGQASRAERP
jgi:hypothetical protein